MTGKKSGASLSPTELKTFQATPGLNAIICQINEAFVIAAASDDFIAVFSENRDPVGAEFFQIIDSKLHDPETATQKIRSSFLNVIKTGKRDIIDNIRYADGAHAVIKQTHRRIINSPILDESGEIKCIVHAAIDISDQIFAERKADSIMQIETKWREIANSMPAIVWTAYADGRINFLNERWFELTGMSIPASLDFGWTNALHPDDRERCIEVWKKSSQNQTFYEIEVRYALKNGNYRWFLARGVPIKEGSELVAWYGTSADIHEQKKLKDDLEEIVLERTRELKEQKAMLDSILANSVNGISVTEMIRNPEGEVIDATTLIANDAAIRLTGLPKEIYLGKRATEIDPNIISSPYGQACLRTLKTGEPSIIRYFLDITGRWLELTMSRMDADHLIHIFTDVTPMVEAERHLERTIEDLKRSNANLEEFAYASSHDLKEPVRKIRYFANRLKDELAGKLEIQQLHFLERLESASERMSELIDDLLTYSTATKGKSEYEVIDLNITVTQVLQDLELEISQKNAIVHVSSLPGIKGDRRQMLQLFQNLLSNALKYSRPGSAPEIKIESHSVKGKDAKSDLLPEEAERMYHLIEIRDKGIGFSEDDAEKIFNVFTRLHNNSIYKGTGVGLSIVRKVVENHNGFVWAQSTPGEGAVFKILLPES